MGSVNQTEFLVKAGLNALLHFKPKGSRKGKVFVTSRYCWVLAFRASARPTSKAPFLASEIRSI